MIIEVSYTGYTPTCTALAAACRRAAASASEAATAAALAVGVTDGALAAVGVDEGAGTAALVTAAKGVVTGCSCKLQGLSPQTKAQPCTQ